MEYKHKCIKPGCETFYTDTDPEAYYCKNCNETKKEIAKQIDAKLANLPKKQVKSGMQQYNELSKKGVGGFPKASDLGIKL